MRNVESAAERLLNEHSVVRPPVPVEQLAKALGLSVQYEHYDGDISGLLYRDSNVSIIGVNAAHSMTRQRFTIAHELGHFMLHRGRPLIVDKQFRINFRNSASSLATDHEEIQANGFAATLLMPRGWVEKAALRLIRRLESLSDDDLVERLASRFNVSPQAMSFRLINLGLRSPSD